MRSTAVAAPKDTPFTWVGKDKRGNKIRGKILAVNEQAARADLRRQNIVPTKLRKQRSMFGGGGKITPGDIALFSRQLATMLASGIPLVQAFEIVGVGHEKQAMQKLIREIQNHIVGGSARRRRGRDLDPAALRDPAVRGAVQGLRRGPAGIYAGSRGSFQVRADAGLVDGPHVRRRRDVLRAHEEALSGAPALPRPRVAQAADHRANTD